jgi:hypothetical protein
MAVKAYVTVDADFPRAPTPDGSPSLPPGLDLAEFLCQGLRTEGFTSPGVKQHDSYGWYFEVRTPAGVVVWSMLQLSDSWLLITRPLVPLLKRVFGESPDREHQTACDAIDAILRRDQRFRNIRWYTREEFLAQTTAGRHRGG